VVRDEDHLRASSRAGSLAEALYERLPPGIRLRGPAPCPISRIAGKHRHQIELFAPSAAELQNVLAAARSAGLVHHDASLAVDVDPIDLL
jgi:primosomal protein N' (replication factor Y)